MKALSELAEANPEKRWNPRSKVGRALKEHEGLLSELVRKGHGDKAIFDAAGLDAAEFNGFRSAMRGFRSHLRESSQ